MKWIERLPWIAAAVFALAPVLAVPSAVTNDGPSHVYNAWVAAELESGNRSELAHAFEVDRGIGQTLVSATVLQWLGPWLGWDLAERVWVGTLLLGLLLAVAWYVRQSGAPPGLLIPLLLAWIPLSLMAAWGFYDFLLGAAIFALLLAALEDDSLPRIGLLLALLFVAHLFVFVIGLGVVTLRALQRKDLRPVAVVATAGGAVLVLAGGVLEAELAMGFDPGQRMIQLAFSHVVSSVSRAGMVAGIAWTGLLVFGLLRLPRDWRVYVGLALLAGAIVMPTEIAGGSILFERVHLLALIALAPVVATASTRLGRGPALALGLVLVAALTASLAKWTTTGQALHRDRVEIASLLNEAEIPEGGWVGSAFPQGEWKVYRAPLHTHLVDRVALDLGLVAGDNYEAGVRPFPVTWAPGHGTLHIRDREGLVEISGAALCDLYIVHAPGARVQQAGATTLATGHRFAVSVVRGSGCPPAPPALARGRD